MGSAAELTEPTTGTEQHNKPVKMEEEEEEEEEEDEQVFELERKTFRHGKGHDTSADTSSINTTTNTSSSSSFSSDFHYGEGERTVLLNLEVPESPEQVTDIGFQEELHDGNNCNVFFDGEQGSESAGGESDAHESPIADHLIGETKQSESENGLTSEDNKVSHEIEEVKDGDSPKELDVVDQPTGDVIEEEVEIGDVEDYDVEKVLDNQETHDLFCPNCNSCITKRVVLKRRKRKIRHVLEDPKRLRGQYEIDTLIHSEDNLPSTNVGENSVHESFMFKCLSCFSIFIPKGMGSKPIPPPSEGVEELKTQPNPEEEAIGDSNWFSSIFGFNKNGSAVQQGWVMSSVPEANLPRDNLSLPGEDTTGSTANIPSRAPALVQDNAATSIQDVSEISASQAKIPVDTSWIQGT